MRISDWSSDVCSSDLQGEGAFGHLNPLTLTGAQRPGLDVDGDGGAADAEDVGIGAEHVADIDRTVEHHGVDGDGGNAPGGARTGGDAAGDVHLRQASEERRGGQEWVRTGKPWGSPYQ